MAKETKAQREARWEAETAALQAKRATEYLPRLMAALEEATNKNNYELMVVDGKFKLRNRDVESWYDPTWLSPTYSMNDFDVLEDLEFELNLARQAREEAERKLATRQAALAKLTKEEREALGL